MHTAKDSYNANSMKATDILRNEHDNILQSIALLLEFCHRHRNGEAVSKIGLSLLVDFFRVYADMGHHEKEEKVLFPQMIAHGFPSNNSPISVMLHEHTTGRNLLQKMTLNLLDYDHSAEAKNDFFLNAMEFGLFLQQHIHKENMILFAMADRLFDKKNQDDLFILFNKISETVLNEHFKQNTWDPLQKIIKDDLISLK